MPLQDMSWMNPLGCDFSLLLYTEDGKKWRSDISVEVISGVIVIVQRKRDTTGRKSGGQASFLVLSGPLCACVSWL